MLKKVGAWIVKVIWPVFEPIIRWGIRLSIIGGLVWLTFYAEFAAPVRVIAIDGLTTFSSDLGKYLKGLLPESNGDAGQSSLFQQTEEDRRAEKARKQKKAVQLKQKYDQCLATARSQNRSCVISDLMNSRARQVCEQRRLQQVDRCEDRYGG